MARTNYDPLEKHPLFDGTLDQVGVIAQLFGCDVVVLVNEPRKPARDVAGNYW